MKVCGYAAPFCRTIDFGGIRETIAPHAFDEMLRKKKSVALQFETHDPAPALARTGNGSLRLAVDDFGLRFEADLNPRDAAVRAAEYEIAQDKLRCSVNFADWSVRSFVTADFQPSRYVLRATINHICLTRDPAYQETGCWRPQSFGRGTPDRLRTLANRFEWSECRQL